MECAGGVRVVIHTANLLFGDCTHKTQGAWVQDFPPKVASPFPEVWIRGSLVYHALEC